MLWLKYIALVQREVQPRWENFRKEKERKRAERKRIEEERRVERGGRKRRYNRVEREENAEAGGEVGAEESGGVDESEKIKIDAEQAESEDGHENDDIELSLLDEII